METDRWNGNSKSKQEQKGRACVASQSSHCFFPSFPHIKQRDKEIQPHQTQPQKTNKSGIQLEANSGWREEWGWVPKQLGSCSSGIPCLLSLTFPGILGGWQFSWPHIQDFQDQGLLVYRWESPGALIRWCGKGKICPAHTHGYCDTPGPEPGRSIFTRVLWLRLQITRQTELALLPVLTLWSG